MTGLFTHTDHVRVARRATAAKLFVPFVLFALCSGVTVAAEEEAAPVESAAPEEPVEESIEEILTREPEAEDYGEQRRCIQNNRIRRTEVLDEKHVALSMGGDKYYIIRFKPRCPGLRAGRPIIVEPSSSNRLCVLDGIRPTYDNGFGNLTPGGRCSIPGFQPVTTEQVVMLKDALKVEKRQEREARRAARQAQKDLERAERRARKQSDS